MKYSLLLEQIRNRINSAEQIFFNDDDLISEFGVEYENYLSDVGRYDTSLVGEAFFEYDEVAQVKPEILLNPPASMDEYKILRMRFVRYIDSKGRDIRSFGDDTSPDSLFDENVYYPIQFITTQEKFDQFVTQLATFVLSEISAGLSIKNLLESVNKMIINYLGLNEYSDEYRFRFLNDGQFIDLILSDIQFTVNEQSKFLPIEDLIVRMKNEHIQDVPKRRLYFEILRLLHRAKDNALPLHSLTLKLNVSDETFILPKPILKKELISFLENYTDRFEIVEDTIRLKQLIKFTTMALQTNSCIIKDFDDNNNFPGIVFIKFIGKEFPLKEASSYLDLRPIIFISVVGNLSDDFTNILKSNNSEFKKCLLPFFKDQDSYIDWATKNLAATFLIEDEDFLMLNFDKLMTHFSPIFNLEKNPGNLFRSIIEDRIKEHENGSK